jgi:hypothetical protein
MILHHVDGCRDLTAGSKCISRVTRVEIVVLTSHHNPFLFPAAHGTYRNLVLFVVGDVHFGVFDQTPVLQYIDSWLHI